MNRLAAELYFKHGPMTDESLFLLFCDMEVDATQEQIADIRRALECAGLVKAQHNLIARRSDGKPATVYGVTLQ